MQMSQARTGQDSASTDHLIREWLFRFGLNFGKDVVSLLPLWQEQLGGIEYATLQCLFERALQTCKFFPTIAEILGQIENANYAGLELEAAGAWDRWLKHVKNSYLGDLGWDRRTPQLDAITEHAGNAAGGAHWVERCPEDELQWCRKRFLEAYTNFSELGQVEHLLTRGEAKKIFASLCSGTIAIQPPPAPIRQPDPGPSEPDRAAIGALAILREKLNTPVPPPADAIPTESEWEARKARQLRALNEAYPTWREDHQRRIRLYVQLSAAGFSEQRIAKQLFPGRSRKEQLYLLTTFANIHRQEIETSAGAHLPASESAREETRCAG